jgi:ribonuclease III
MSGRRNDGDGTEAADPSGLLRALGVPMTADTMERALTHRSYAYENGGLPTNERLEFLGDSVLSLVVTDTLYKGHPTLPEGQLAKLRAAVVQMSTLAEVAARELNLGSFVRLGRGEEGTGGRDKPSILADTLEAVIGATYIDCGLDEASGLVHRLFDPVIQRSALLGAGLDWKTSLQELTADRGLGVPEYHVRDSGPDHQKMFRAVVKVGARDLGEGEGRSKKAAEQLAAEAAYLSITANDAAEKAEDQHQPDPERTSATVEPSAGSVKGARASGSAPDSSAKSSDGAVANSGPTADPSASSVNAALHDSVPPQPGSADAVDA